MGSLCVLSFRTKEGIKLHDPNLQQLKLCNKQVCPSSFSETPKPRKAFFQQVIPLDIEVRCHNIHGLALMILKNRIEDIR